MTRLGLLLNPFLTLRKIRNLSRKIEKADPDLYEMMKEVNKLKGIIAFQLVSYLFLFYIFLIVVVSTLKI